jgi:hypothetical protein
MPVPLPLDEMDVPFDLGADVYRRRILVETVEPGMVVSTLEDDFHHFVVTLRHDGTRVVDATSESFRWPWATCPAAGLQLAGLVGMELSPRFTAAARFTDASHNCTHQFDAAAHAVTHAAAGGAHDVRSNRSGQRAVGAPTIQHRREVRQYDVEIGALLRVVGADGSGAGRNRLWVDGQFAMEWRLQPGRGIVDPPPPFDEAPWKGGFMRWADATLPPDAAERAIVLRRACDIGMGRGMPLDAIPVASQLPSGMSGVCYAQQPETAPDGVRHRGSIRDFSTNPELLCTSPHNRVGEVPVIAE